MSPPARTARTEALARSYGGDRDGWTRVEEYQRVTECAAAHPDAGSTAVASALDLPRSRIRPWLDSSRIQLQKARSAGYRRGLAAFVCTVVEDSDAVAVGDVAVRIDSQYAALLDVVPRLPNE